MANRTLCDVLHEMRAAYKTRNFAGLLGLVEEAQTMGNRMEASLYDKKGLETMEQRRRTLKAKLKNAEEVLLEAKHLADDVDNEELSAALDDLRSVAAHRDW